MSKTYQTITGTFDILPDTSTSDGTPIPASAEWLYVESVVRDVMGRFNADEIRTPILEETELIARGVGEMTDIVSKEMFTVERGEASYVLRPEITAPVMRAYLQHHLDQRGGVQKLFYIGPCFRAERPQKGRYRQFHQFGCEIIGTDDARADVEVIAMMLALYDELGISRTELKINTLGDVSSRPRYRQALQDYLSPHQSKLTETSRKRLATNPLRILDTKEPAEKALLEDAPRLVDHVDEQSRQHYEEVKSLLVDLGITFREDDFLVRGLDYYTRTAFELESADLGAQSALAGGGRYDLLSEEIGSKKPIGAVGFAAGFERLFLAIQAQGISLPARQRPDLFLVALGDEATRRVFHVAQSLRREGLQVALDLKGRSMKAQMREANRQNALYAAIIGKDELAGDVAQIKDMGTGEQVEIQMSDLYDYVKARGAYNPASQWTG